MLKNPQNAALQGYPKNLPFIPSKISIPTSQGSQTGLPQKTSEIRLFSVIFALHHSEPQCSILDGSCFKAGSQQLDEVLFSLIDKFDGQPPPVGSEKTLYYGESAAALQTYESAFRITNRPSVRATSVVFQDVQEAYCVDTSDLPVLALTRWRLC